MLSDLTTRFAKVSAVDIDDAINECLLSLGESLGLDECLFGRIYGNGREVRTTHRWRSPAVQGLPEIPFDRSTHPAHIQKLLEGVLVLLSEEVPSAVAMVFERGTDFYLTRGNTLLIPVAQGPWVRGFVAVRSLTKDLCFAPSDANLLQGCVNVLGSGLTRICSEQHLQEKQTEQAALRLALYRSSRISTMGGMTAALAHEINQPLAAILINAQAAEKFLDGENPSLDEFREITRDIVSDVKRARDVIVKLRALFQKSNPSLAPMDINEALTEISPLLHSQLLLRRVELKDDRAAGLPAVQADRVQIQQVLINLVLNGIDAMKDSVRRELIITTRLTGESVTVSLSDSGPGIPAEVLNHLFEPFFTTKDGGMGMGLAINKAIISAHGGTLTASNNPDGGATFSFTIPLAVKAAAVREEVA
jgi:signal transduction histidine kinase